MKFWMMLLWLKNYKKIEWLDLLISQFEDVGYVLIRDDDYFERVIEEMCFEGFFIVYGYRYVQWDVKVE